MKGRTNQVLTTRVRAREELIQLESSPGREQIPEWVYFLLTMLAVAVVCAVVAYR